MVSFEKLLFTIVSILIAGLLTFLAFIIHDVSTTKCLERGTVKRIISVDGNANRAVVELTDGSIRTLTLGRITEGKTVCKTYGRNDERTN